MYYSSGVREGGVEMSDVREWCPGDAADLGFEGEGGIHYDAKVLRCRGGDDIMSTDEKGEVPGRRYS